MGMTFMHTYGQRPDPYDTQPLFVDADDAADVRAERKLRGLEGHSVTLLTHAVSVTWPQAVDVTGNVLGFTYTMRGTRVICLQTAEHALVAVPVRAVDAVRVERVDGRQAPCL